MANIIESYERYNYFRDTSIDQIIAQIKNGTIRCGANASKLKYGVPPKEVKGWWLTNDKHRSEEEKEKGSIEPAGSESDHNRELREPKEDLVHLLREIDKRRRNGGKRIH